MEKCLTIIIEGAVQGVFFRAFAKKQAQRFGLVGYAENLPDGSVRIVVKGDTTQHLEDFLEWCRHGPPFARVANVSFQWDRAKGNTEGFEIR